jgi:hypothetical protein
MKLSMKSKAVGIVGAAGALAMVAGGASATGVLVGVTANGSATSQSLVASTSATPGVTFTAGTAVMTCASSNVTSTATVNGGAPASVLNVVTLPIGSVNFVTCTGPGGANTVTQLAAWQLHVTGGYTNSAGDTLVTGHIDNAQARVQTTIPTVCSFTTQGSASATYNETTGVLTVSENGSNLSINTVSGCGGNFASGDPATFNAVYYVQSVGGTPFSAGQINVTP